MRTPLNSRMTSLTCRLARSAGDLGSTREMRVPARSAEAERLGSLLVEIDIELHAQEAAGDFVISDERFGDVAGDVDRDREADAFVAAGGAGDGGVEADDFAAEIHERAAAVAGVDGGVGLNEVLQFEVFVAEVEVVATFGADDAAGHALAEAERAADGEHEVADLELVAIAELGRFEAAGVDGESGDVGFAVAPNLFGMKHAAIVQVNFNPLRR